MKLDKETANFMDFRQEKFSNQLKEINDIVTGRNAGLSAYISDENGNISDERLESFISDLIEGLVNYKQQLHMLPYNLSEETRELYECFLYCTIQGVAYMKYVDLLHYSVVRNVSTFSDILDVLYNSFTYKSRRELVYDEMAGYDFFARDKGFIRNCNLAYELLTDTDISAEYSDEEMTIATAIKEELQAKKQSQPVHYDYDDEDEDKDYFKQIEREQLAQKPPMTAEEMLSRSEGSYNEEEPIFGDEELVDEATASHDKWRKSVVSPEKFIAKYLRYRELFFALDHSRMKDDIEKMIDIFLYEQGVSAFSLGERYVMIPYRTDRFCGVLKSEIRKARCK